MVGIKCVIGLFSNPRQGLSNAAQTLKNLNITEFIFLFLLIFFLSFGFNKKLELDLDESFDEVIEKELELMK